MFSTKKLDQVLAGHECEQGLYCFFVIYRIKDIGSSNAVLDLCLSKRVPCCVLSLEGIVSIAQINCSSRASACSPGQLMVTKLGTSLEALSKAPEKSFPSITLLPCLCVNICINIYICTHLAAWVAIISDAKRRQYVILWANHYFLYATLLHT